MLQLVNHCSVYTLSLPLLELHNLFIRLTVILGETERYHLGPEMIPEKDIAMINIGV